MAHGKEPPAVQEMQVQSLDQEDPLEREMETHSSMPAWEIPWPEETGMTVDGVAESNRTQQLNNNNNNP